MNTGSEKPAQTHRVFIEKIITFKFNTEWPVIHGRVFLVPCKTTFLQCTLLCTVAYTKVTFYKGLE